MEDARAEKSRTISQKLKALYAKRYYERNKEKVAEYHKKWRAANRAKYAESQKRIRDRREMEGLTQKQFAKLMGVSNTTVSDWETGRRQANWELVLEVFPDLEPEL